MNQEAETPLQQFAIINSQLSISHAGMYGSLRLTAEAVRKSARSTPVYYLFDNRPMQDPMDYEFTYYESADLGREEDEGEDEDGERA